jgi:hypothetical protein
MFLYHTVFSYSFIDWVRLCIHKKLFCLSLALCKLGVMTNYLTNYSDIYLSMAFGTVAWIDVKEYETIQPDKIVVDGGNLQSLRHCLFWLFPAFGHQKLTWTLKHLDFQSASIKNHFDKNRPKWVWKHNRSSRHDSRNPSLSRSRTPMDRFIFLHT